MSITLRGYVFPNEVDRILKAPGGPVGAVVRKLAMDTARHAEAISISELGNRHPSDAPRTGKFARSWEVKVESDPQSGFKYVVKNRKKQAATLESGSRPHEIKARKAKFLRFKSRKTGKWVTVKVVYHPGQKTGYKILERALIRSVRENLRT